MGRPSRGGLSGPPPSLADLAHWLAAECLAALATAARWPPAELADQPPECITPAATVARSAERVAAAVEVGGAGRPWFGGPGGGTCPAAGPAGCRAALAGRRILRTTSGGGHAVAAALLPLPCRRTRPGEPFAAAPVPGGVLAVSAAQPDAARQKLRPRRQRAWLAAAMAVLPSACRWLAGKLARLAAVGNRFRGRLGIGKAGGHGRVRRRGRPRDQQSAGGDRRPGPTLLHGRTAIPSGVGAGPDQRPGDAGLRDDRRYAALRPAAGAGVAARGPRRAGRRACWKQLGPRPRQQDTRWTAAATRQPLALDGRSGAIDAWPCGRCVVNALEALGHDGRIEMACRCCRGPRADSRRPTTGRALRPNVRPHLFDPFYSARQAGRGLGMGLAKCWRIVTNHGGRIDVESQPGHGAVFVVTLPGGVGSWQRVAGNW